MRVNTVLWCPSILSYEAGQTAVYRKRELVGLFAQQLGQQDCVRQSIIKIFECARRPFVVKKL